MSAVQPRARRLHWAFRGQRCGGWSTTFIGSRWRMGLPIRPSHALLLALVEAFVEDYP